MSNQLQPIAYLFSNVGVFASNDGVNFITDVDANNQSINATANSFGLTIQVSSNSIIIGNSTVFNSLNSTAWTGTSNTNPSVALAAVEFVIDGGGGTIVPGLKGYLEVPFACTIQQVTLLADQTGSVVVDIWKSSYANFSPGTHPVVADSIVASAPPTISAALKYQDTTLTGWTKNISAGDILAFNVNSSTTIQKVTVSLKVTR